MTPDEERKAKAERAKKLVRFLFPEAAALLTPSCLQLAKRKKEKESLGVYSSDWNSLAY
jgi:hypothetical protein